MIPPCRTSASCRQRTPAGRNERGGRRPGDGGNTRGTARAHSPSGFGRPARPGGGRASPRPERAPGGVSVAGGLALLAAGAPLLGLVAWLFVRYPAAIVAGDRRSGAAPLALPRRVRRPVHQARRGRRARAARASLRRARGGGLALLWRLARGEEPRPLPPVLAVPAALLVALMVASPPLGLRRARPPNSASRSSCSPSPSSSPFVARAPFRAWLPRVLAIEAVALGCLFAVVGLAEACDAQAALLRRRSSQSRTAYTSYFRVTSFFTDPSIYARHLAVALTMLVVVWLWLGRVALARRRGARRVICARDSTSPTRSRRMVALAAAVCLVRLPRGRAAGPNAIATGVVAPVCAGAAAFGALVAAGHSVDASDQRPWTLVAGHVACSRTTRSPASASRRSPPRPRRGRRPGRTRRDSRTPRRSRSRPSSESAALLLYVAFLAGAARLSGSSRGRRGARARAARRAHRALRALALLRRLLRGSARLGRAGRGYRRLVAPGPRSRERAARTRGVAPSPPSGEAGPAGEGRERRRLEPRRLAPARRARRARARGGSDARRRAVALPARARRADGAVRLAGRGADGEWDLGRPSRRRRCSRAFSSRSRRSWRPSARRWPRWAAVTLTAPSVCLLAVPAVALQAGLRQSSAPWFFTNDSTYQIELAGRPAARRRKPIRPRLLRTRGSSGSTRSTAA